MADFKIDSNLKEWNRTFEDYIQWNKRSLAEVINQKLYFVALRAMQETKMASSGDIKHELNSPSKKYPNMSLGELLVIRDLKAKGKMPKRGSTFAKNLPNYVQRLINKRVNHIQFLRSGWLPAVRKLDMWNRKGDSNSITFSRRFAPKKPQGVKQFGKDKGNVRPAILGSYTPGTCRGTIYNFVGTGKQHSKTVTDILQRGLDKAVVAEMRSMRQYMERKWLEEHRRRASKGEFSIV